MLSGGSCNIERWSRSRPRPIIQSACHVPAVQEDGLVGKQDLRAPIIVPQQLDVGRQVPIISSRGAAEEATSGDSRG